MNKPCRLPLRAHRIGRFGWIVRVFTALALLLAYAVPQMTLAAGPANYPRYRLIDFGTLGGSNSSSFGPSIQLNSRGQALAQSETTIPDPYAPPDCDDCFVWHGVVLEHNGLVTDLGSLPGSNASVPVGISESGLIAGFSQYGVIDPLFSSAQWQAVLWKRDRSILGLGTLGGNCSTAYSVNSRGQVVGMALNAVPEDPDLATSISVDCPASTQARAFLWQNGSMQDLGTLGGNDAAAGQVNEGGQIVGISYTDTTPNPAVHPFLWQNGVMTDLGSLGGSLAVLGGIGVGGTRVLNDSGQVVGQSTLPGDEMAHAFLWSNGTMIDLGTLGGRNSNANAINNKGQVVGGARVSDTPFVRHAFLWEKGQMSDLGAVAPCRHSEAHSINAASQIIGTSSGCPGTFNESGFYAEKGKPIVDLNTLVDPPSPIHIDSPWNINDRGEIFGSGLLPDGSARAVLLVPVPGH